MELTLNRQPSWHETTLGVLFVDGECECFSLEDQVRHAAKVPGATAIPAGRYPVRITWSPKFQRDMPEICDVPDFEGIRIHPGNSAEDTEGCVLVGTDVSDAQHIINSRVAFDRLFAKLRAAEGEIWIDVRDGDGA